MITFHSYEGKTLENVKEICEKELNNSIEIVFDKNGNFKHYDD